MVLFFFLLPTEFWPTILVTIDFCDVEFNDGPKKKKKSKYSDFCENIFIDY